MSGALPQHGFLVHAAAGTAVRGAASDVFAFLDTHENIAGHMDRPSWAMLGGTMKASLDADAGKREGSVIRIESKVLGIAVSLTEQIVQRVPPRAKQWETFGTPKLIVMGRYRMGFEIVPSSDICSVTVSIDYDFPRDRLGRCLGKLFGPTYARWCLKQIIVAAENQFHPVASLDQGTMPTSANEYTCARQHIEYQHEQYRPSTRFPRGAPAS